MKAYRSDLKPAEIPRPEAQPGELLVSVHAAGITPTELQWSTTTHTRSGEPRTGAVPAHEFSGIVAGTGEAVYGMNDWFAEGALAEFCVTRPEWIAPKPRNLTHAEAASVPIGALTAWQGLLVRAGVEAGDRVLIHGGAGGVGAFAVQLARSRGAHVIATVSARNADFVRQLGADEVIDYHAAPFETEAREIDVVFDTVGGETLARSWSVLKSQGRMVTIAATVESSTDERDKSAFFIVEPNRDQLIEIGRMLDAGSLRTVVAGTVPFQLAPQAFAAKAGRGKWVVTVS